MSLQGFGLSHDVLVMRGATIGGMPRQIRFWAERGLIHCEDSLDNEYSSMTVRQFLHRVRGINDMLCNSAASADSGADMSLREETQRNVEKAMEIAAKAQVQGMPSDASARRDLVNRRSKTIAVTDRRGIM